MDTLSSLGIIHERINKELQNALKDVGIKVSCGHIWLLTLVYQNGGFIEIRELVRTLEKKKTTVSEMVGTLERNGYLKKYQSVEDKRIFCVKTTPKADQMKDEILRIVESISKKITMDISGEDLALTEKTIEKMAHNLK